MRTDDTTIDGRVVGLLAGHLIASPWFHCPGVDGACAGDVVAAEYPAAVAAGRVPPPSELAARNPDLAAALRRFFGAAALAG